MFSHVLCSVFYDNTGSAVLLRNSLLYVSGDALFVKNKADIGAAINIQEGSRVSEKVTDLQAAFYFAGLCNNFLPSAVTLPHTWVQVRLKF